MSEQETAVKPAKKKTGNPAVVWTVRIVVFGALGALLIAAILEFRVKSQMTASQKAIGDKLESNDGFSFSVKDAEELMEGDWESADVKAQGFHKKKIYTWSSPFSKFLPHRLAITYRTIGKTTYVEKVSNEVDDLE